MRPRASRRRVRCARITFFVAVMGLGAAAAAQPADGGHFDLGVALFARGQYEDALREFEASRAIRETASVVQNVGACLQALSRHAEAIEAFRRAAEIGQGVWGAAERRRVARTIQDLRGRVAELTVRANVDGAEVRVDGRVASGPAAIDPGREAVVEVTSPGHRAVQTTVRPLVPGPFDLSVTLEPLPRAGRLTLSANVRPALARADGGAPHPLPWSADLEPGDHVIAIDAPGYRRQERSIAVRAGEELRLEVVLEPQTTPTSARARRGATASVHTREPTPRRAGPGPLPWVLGSVGAAVLIATGALIWTLSDRPLEGDWIVEGP